MNRQHFKNEHVEMWIENGIIFSVHAEKVLINLEIAKVAVEARLKLSNGVTMPMLTDGRNVRGINKAARDYLAGGDAIKYISAGALIVKNEVQRLIGTLFISFNEPPIPTKLFTDQKAAIRYLQHYKNLN